MVINRSYDRLMTDQFQQNPSPIGHQWSSIGHQLVTNWLYDRLITDWNFIPDWYPIDDLLLTDYVKNRHALLMPY